ncbi:G patch domain-containing protein 2 [Dioscorea alata]|uniref:G patch domain-containing protein 2 n=1 Tax=Dioscorea alata TaxID=55571 RepID=A0ACB7WJQ8_DIOAL|nr:G patch domain-containing protein 2 [Dioscorea alata]
MRRNKKAGSGSRPRSVSSQSPNPNPTKKPNNGSVGRFVDGGMLTDWQPSTSGKPRRKIKDFRRLRGNAFPFKYPSVGDADDSPVVGAEEEEEEEIKNERKNEGFLSIGGLRLYTEDVSSPDEAMDEDQEEEQSSSESVEDVEEGEGSIEDDDLSSSIDLDDSDIDDDVVEDYLEGIGGSSELLGSEWLAGRSLEEYDEDGLLKSRSNSDGDDVKIGGSALMNASMEYGMKKGSVRKAKEKKKSVHGVSSIVDADIAAFYDDLLTRDSKRCARPIPDAEISELYDALVIKDSRRGARHRKLVSSQGAQSWPGEAQMSKRYKNVIGGKKKHRKELIAVKRRERMLNRGVDLDEINLKLREMVLNELDTLSFAPMHSRDCTQVQRLASVYHLRSGCQGSGKKRFVVVTRTAHSCLPSSIDTVRLEKLLGVGNEDEDFTVNDIKSKPQKLSRRMSSKSLSRIHSSAPSKLRKNEASGSKKQASKKSSLSERPVSFVSYGAMQSDQAPTPAVTDSSEINTGETSVHSCPPKLGSFEVHTKGFGSKMMAKMGFIEGGGLGKDGKGMVQPIEPTRRPKSLGLGVEYTEKTPDLETPATRSFEQHTKGFGSKMMMKMGFIPGTGLGKDAQGITTPLTAVRMPKSRGLGAT